MKRSHNYLDDGHKEREWRTWAVIILCTISMLTEIICGVAFGSLALVADGAHMGTHVLAFFITASAYSYSRIHADDPKFVFGTGKVGELASFTCAILLLVVSLVIVYEGVNQLMHPKKLDFIPALSVSFVGLSVNLLSGLLLIFPCGKKNSDMAASLHVNCNHDHVYFDDTDLEAALLDGGEEGTGRRQASRCTDAACVVPHRAYPAGYTALSSSDPDRTTSTPAVTTSLTTTAPKYTQDNNFRAAVLHVLADAFVSMLTIVAIAIAGTVKGAWFLNPLVGIVGAAVIVSWAYQLIGDTMGALLDLCPDPALQTKLSNLIEADGQSMVTDLHLWKLCPGKLGLIVAVQTTQEGREREYYASKLSKIRALVHITVEIERIPAVSVCSDCGVPPAGFGVGGSGGGGYGGSVAAAGVGSGVGSGGRSNSNGGGSGGSGGNTGARPRKGSKGRGSKSTSPSATTPVRSEGSAVRSPMPSMVAAVVAADAGEDQL